MAVGYSHVARTPRVQVGGGLSHGEDLGLGGPAPAGRVPARQDLHCCVALIHYGFLFHSGCQGTAFASAFQAGGRGAGKSLSCPKPQSPPLKWEEHHCLLLRDHEGRGGTRQCQPLPPPVLALQGRCRSSPEKPSPWRGDRREEGRGRTSPLQGSGCCGPGSSEQAGGQGPPGVQAALAHVTGGCRCRPAFYVPPGDSQPISACATAESCLHGPCQHQARSCRCANVHVDKNPVWLQGLGGTIPTRKRGPESALCPRPRNNASCQNRPESGNRDTGQRAKIIVNSFHYFEEMKDFGPSTPCVTES